MNLLRFHHNDHNTIVNMDRVLYVRILEQGKDHLKILFHFDGRSQLEVDLVEKDCFLPNALQELVEQSYTENNLHGVRDASPREPQA